MVVVGVWVLPAAAVREIVRILFYAVQVFAILDRQDFSGK
jgi:hypothetical protein